MIQRLPRWALITCTLYLAFSTPGMSGQDAATGGRPPMPPAREIPGLTAGDRFPNGCVDCHINMPDMNMDVRLSVQLKQLSQKVEPALLLKIQGTMRGGAMLKGKHPPVPKSAFESIPSGCLKCHGMEAKKAPPLGAMLHKIHLVGGEDNPFLTLFQGECTHCHKLDVATGSWFVPSAGER